MHKIFIDGREGTTGLEIYDRLSLRTDIELILIDEDKRKDINERKKLINEVKRGILFVGFEVKPHRLLLCKVTVNRVFDSN